MGPGPYKLTLIVVGAFLSCGILTAQSRKPDTTHPSRTSGQEAHRPDPFGFGLTVYGETKPESARRRILLTPVRELKRTAVDMVTCRDKVFCVAAWSYVAAYGVDMITTDRVFNRCPTCIETGAFLAGSRARGSLAATYGGVTIANLTFAHFWKRQMKQAVLRQIWPAGLVSQGAAHAWAANHNEKIVGAQH